MTAIKPITLASKKWVNRAAVAGGDYQEGVRNPRRPWEASSVAAEANYKLGVTAAANAGKFGKGVRRAGDAKWQGNAILKGPGRFAEGVAVGEKDWEAGFSPYHQGISSLTLPPRGPTGSIGNYQRSQVVGVTLRGIKDRMGGG